MLKQYFSFYRLGQISMGAASYGARPGRRIGVGRDDDQRHGGTNAPLVPQQIDSAEARHAHVGDQAIKTIRFEFGHEGLRSIKCATRDVHRPKKFGKSLSHSFVVVYDGN
ncbi:hypothetical protein AYJ54_44880 [Bradyrhizobium centrolobii]|uniref:Uncharacterized protein n=1 Tax=Bradyrhizobium centrolobii TaxID=1505087 RepID=A0A176Z048_9BRAD|nr:hypothetical protein AYJ54_44880 [Bradyrhizobium centrolobii]